MCLARAQALPGLPPVLLRTDSVQNVSGLSLLKQYLHFTDASGWVSLLNVAALKPVQLPTGLVADVPACFVHEAEYPQLKLCRPLLSKQLNLFRNVVRRVPKRCHNGVSTSRCHRFVQSARM